MKFLLLAFFLSNDIMASNLNFSGDKQKYQAILTKEKIAIQSQFIEVDVKKEKCNSFLILSFIQDFEKSKKVISTSDKDFYGVEVNSKKYKILKRSSFGKYLFNLPQKIISLKKKSSLSCKKSPES